MSLLVSVGAFLLSAMLGVLVSVPILLHVNVTDGIEFGVITPLCVVLLAVGGYIENCMIWRIPRYVDGRRKSVSLGPLASGLGLAVFIVSLAKLDGHLHF